MQNEIEVINISDIDEKLLLLIRYMARDGMSDKEITKRLGITKKKFSQLIKNFDENSSELIYSKMLTDYEVESALLKKALGGVSCEVKTTEKSSGTETVTVTKEIPGDTSALQFWLKNKCPEKWSDKNADMIGVMERLDKIFEEISNTADNAKSLGDC